MSYFNVDSNRIVGTVKPMHAVNNGPLGSAATGKWEYLKEAGIPYARLHDTGGPYGGHVFVDIANVFRNFDADASNPDNYDFAFTDWLLNTLVENGTEPFYRLGSTIENSHWIKPYNIFPPKDNMQWAKICEGIIRHYTEGWGNGFYHKITYWEIWNEPDNMPDIKDNPMWKGTKEQFFELYRVAANYLKEKFPHLKIGGYGCCGFYKITQELTAPEANVSPRNEYFIEFFHAFMKYITDEKTKAPLDFFSWHAYSGVAGNIISSNYVREQLDKYGLKDTEHMCNEWNTGVKLYRSKLRDATNIAANMLALHQTSIGMLMYYDWRLQTVYNGAINPVGYVPFKAFYSFKAFNELYRLGNEISVETNENQIVDRVYCMAAKGEEGIAVMFANYSNEDREITLTIDGNKDLNAQVFIVDEDKTYEDIGVITGGKIILKKDAVALVKLCDK
ncbi:MAG: hypothetical protein IJA88_00995 [Clostridia bacterium]|nr:hypothetical protein [Clostridia bacterium]